MQQLLFSIKTFMHPTTRGEQHQRITVVSKEKSRRVSVHRLLLVSVDGKFLVFKNLHLQSATLPTLITCISTFTYWTVPCCEDFNVQPLLSFSRLRR